MAAGRQSATTVESSHESAQPPQISVCRSCPGTFVFLEAGNTDRWIATDVTVDLRR